MKKINTWRVIQYHRARYWEKPAYLLDTRVKLVSESTFSTDPKDARLMAKQTAESFVKVLGADQKQRVHFRAEKVS